MRCRRLPSAYFAQSAKSARTTQSIEIVGAPFRIKLRTLILLKLHYNSTRSHRPMLQLKWQVGRIGTAPRRWDPWDSGQPRAHLPAENIWLNLEHCYGSPAERKMAMVIGRPLLKLNALRSGPRS